METKNGYSRQINSRLTRAIIKFHEQGYTEEFFVNESYNELYVQNAPDTAFTSYAITVIDQCYDNLTHGFKYVHVIETTCGVKGILVCSKIQFCGVRND